MNRLREWMWDVPAPPALDPGAEDSKELSSFRQKQAQEQEQDAGESG
jgi:NADH-quinone oxidoreductase subunit I